MENTEKFVFKELSKEHLAKSSQGDDAQEQDNIINKAVEKHFDDITTDGKNEINPEQKLEQAVQESEEVIPVLDIAKIKEDEYEKGYKAAKTEDEIIIGNLKSEINLAKNIDNKLSTIEMPTDISDELTNLICQIIHEVANKLYRTLPIKFDKLLSEYLTNLINDNHKVGYIKIKIHPSQLDITNKILELDEMDKTKKELIKIVKDDNLNTDDCEVEWNNGHLEYKIEQIIKEIDTILDVKVKTKPKKETKEG